MKKRIIITLALAVLGTGAFLFSRTAPPANAAPPAAMPDLVIRAETLGDQWVVREENLGANFCSVIEGGITPGERKLLRFTVMTADIGTADLHVGDPNDPKNTGLFEFASCHGHHHFKNYATDGLVVPRTGEVLRAAKRGVLRALSFSFRRRAGSAHCFRLTSFGKGPT